MCNFSHVFINLYRLITEILNGKILKLQKTSKADMNICSWFILTLMMKKNVPNWYSSLPFYSLSSPTAFHFFFFKCSLTSPCILVSWSWCKFPIELALTASVFSNALMVGHSCRMIHHHPPTPHHTYQSRPILSLLKRWYLNLLWLVWRQKCVSGSCQLVF